MPIPRNTAVMSALGLAILAALALTPAARAASDGAVGASSTGSVDIDLVIPELVRIGNLDDIDLGTFAGAGGLTGSDDVCVWSTTRSYQITASGNGAGAALVLVGAASGATLPYSVQWGASGGAPSGAALASGNPLGNLSASGVSPTCDGGSALNASVIVNVAEGDLAAAVADDYSGTLTLLVEPN